MRDQQLENNRILPAIRVLFLLLSLVFASNSIGSCNDIWSSEIELELLSEHENEEKTEPEIELVSDKRHTCFLSYPFLASPVNPIDLPDGWSSILVHVLTPPPERI